MNPEDFKPIQCPIHPDDTMVIVKAWTEKHPVHGIFMSGEFRCHFGCALTFQTGTYWVMKPKIEHIDVKIEVVP